MQYANKRTLRESLYRAYVTRASENAVAPTEAVARAALDNTAIIDELMALRQEEAALLGYANYAEVSLVPKMADTPAQVTKFLRDLAQRARPFAERDLAELRAFAAQELGLDGLQPWDSAYAAERLKEKRYAFSDQEVKQYFQLETTCSTRTRCACECRSRCVLLKGNGQSSPAPLRCKTVFACRLTPQLPAAAFPDLR